MKAHLELITVIGLGGFIGANLRYWVGEWATGQFGNGFPWATLLINLTGSAVLGAFGAWWLAHTGADPRWRLFIAVGFCGAYTTFSTYSLESLNLLLVGNWQAALLNLVVSNVLCLLGARLP